MSSLDSDVKRIAETLRGRIREGEFSFSFARSGGPGGQNVNKVSTRVTLWFDVAGSGLLTEGEKRKIRSRLAGRISGVGLLHVTSRRHRTQVANRRAATQRFFELLAEALRPTKVRRPTRVPRRAVERRLRNKRLAGERKQERGGKAIDREQD